MRVLVTGAAGYIGSHTVLAALRAGHEVLGIDNYANAAPDVPDRLARAAGKPVDIRTGDVRDTRWLEALMRLWRPDAVIHFAGLKAVGESAEIPRTYYEVNVAGTLSLMAAMETAGVRRIVFSSSATVYGEPQYLPIDEDHPLSATNPYGRSKLMVEEILRDQAVARPDWTAALLRYFNPVGADDSGLIGESPAGTPANLMPFVADVAAGLRPAVRVFGDDYDTRDGTGIRDYIHVVDLAEAHLAALDWAMGQTGARAFNLGGGTGTSVHEMVAAFTAAAGRDIPVEIVDRRPGDVAACYADPTRAARELGWQVRRDLGAMCASAWAWRRAWAQMQARSEAAA